MLLSDSKLSMAVIVPAFNAEKTLRNCLRSVKSIQTVPAGFLVVVDDGSSDETSIIAKSYADLVIKNSCRQGKAQSINNALRYIQHKYVLIVDADTCLERRFFEKLERLLGRGEIDCGSRYPVFYGTTKCGRRIADNYNSLTNADPDDWRFHGCCQLFRTEFIRKLLFSDDCLVEDEELFWRLEKLEYEFTECVFPVAVYSKVPDNSKDYFLQKLRWARGACQLLRKYKRRSLFVPPVFSILAVFTMLSLFFSSPTVPLTLFFTALVVSCLNSLVRFRGRYGFLIPLTDDVAFFEIFLLRKCLPKFWDPVV